MRYLEDFGEGQVFELGEETIREQEILDFARRFDAQPFHIDAEAAKRSIYGGLIASGWHTRPLFIGMLLPGLIHYWANLGAAGPHGRPLLQTERTPQHPPRPFAALGALSLTTNT